MWFDAGGMCIALSHIEESRMALVPRVFLTFLFGATKILAFAAFDGFLGCLRRLLDLLTIAGEAVLVGVISARRRAVAFTFILLPSVLLASILLPGVLLFGRLAGALLRILLIAHDASFWLNRIDRVGGDAGCCKPVGTGCDVSGRRSQAVA